MSEPKVGRISFDDAPLRETQSPSRSKPPGNVVVERSPSQLLALREIASSLHSNSGKRQCACCATVRYILSKHGIEG